jgi:hypothetical protein
MREGAADVFEGSVAGPRMSIQRAHGATFRRVFAADLLQVQQDLFKLQFLIAVGARLRALVLVVSSNFYVIKFGSH